MNRWIGYDVEVCKKCALAKEYKKRVPFEIEGKTVFEIDEEIKEVDIIFVGEAPGHQEELYERPFIHKAGNLLRSTIEKIRKQNSDFYSLKIMITNACKCKPTDSKGKIRAPYVDEIEVCRMNLAKDLEYVGNSHKLIVVLGKSASIALQVPGCGGKLENIRGKIYNTKFGEVYVTNHPSAIIRNKYKDLKVFEQDIENCFKYALKKKMRKETEEKQNENIKRFEIKVIRTNAELLEEYKTMKEVLDSSLKKEDKVVTFDYETVPFYWEIIPEVDRNLANLGLNPLSRLADISYVSFSYKKGENIVAFSFPLRAKQMLDTLVSYVENKIKEIKEQKEEIVRKIIDIYSQYEKNKGMSVVLSLYFLFKEHDLSKRIVEEIADIIYRVENKSVLETKVKQILREVIKELDTFRQKISTYIREYESTFDIDMELAEDILKKCLTDKKIKKIVQNPQFEWMFSKLKLGLDVDIATGIDILDYLLGYEKHSLEELEKRYLNLENRYIGYLDKEQSKKEGAKSVYEFAKYNALDSAKTLAIFIEQANIIKKYEEIKAYNSYVTENVRTFIRSANEFLMKITLPFSCNAFLNGLRLDLDKNIELANRIHGYIEDLLRRVEKIIGTREIRTDEFREKLYSLYEWERIITEKNGKPSISESALKTIYERTQNNVLKELVLLVYSIYKYEGLLTRYLEKYPFYILKESERLHPWYNITKVASGRLSCRDPNIQQVPREPFRSCSKCYVVHFDDRESCELCGGNLEVLIDFREVFIPEKSSYFVMADFSQIEMVVLAELSKDENLISAINKKLDMHSYNASIVYGVPYQEIVEKKNSDDRIARMRQNAKRVTFGVIYGASDEGIANMTNLSVEEARHIIETFYAKHPKTKIWTDLMHREALEKGIVVVPTGKIRWFSVDIGDDQFRRMIMRRAQNTPIQGFASDLNLVAAEILRRKYGIKVIGAIHDSIIAEIDIKEGKEQDEIWIKEIFEEAVKNVIKLKHSLKEIGLKIVPDIVENLSVELRIDVKVGKNWKEVK